MLKRKPPKNQKRNYYKRKKGIIRKTNCSEGLKQTSKIEIGGERNSTKVSELEQLKKSPNLSWDGNYSYDITLFLQENKSNIKNMWTNQELFLFVWVLQISEHQCWNKECFWTEVSFLWKKNNRDTKYLWSKLCMKCTGEHLI